MSVLDYPSSNTQADGWYVDVDDSTTSTYSASTTQLESAASYSILHVIITPILYGLITVVGATGNMLVIYVIVAKPRMRSVTNLLLLSLACADLAFVLVVPPCTAYQNATANWPFGDIGCRLMHYMVNVVAYVTVYTLVFIAGLRYATVVHGTETVRYRTRRNATVAAATIWAVMLVVNVPILMSYGVRKADGFVVCDLAEDQVGQRIFATFFGLAYILPLSVIAVFSLCIVRHLANVEKTSSLGAARRAAPAPGGAGSSTSSGNGPRHRGADKKRHAGRLLVLVVVLFALLWLPVHLYLLIYFFYGEVRHPLYEVAGVAFTCLAYFNSCVNPIIYNHASKEFRDAFTEVARCGRTQAQQPVVEKRDARCTTAGGRAATTAVPTTRREATIVATSGGVQATVNATKKNGTGEIEASTTALLASHDVSSQAERRVESGDGSKDDE